MQKKFNAVFGTILVILGTALLLRNFDIITLDLSIGKFWATYFLIIPGTIFHIAFFSGDKKDPGLLVPGGILLGVGIVNQVSTLYGLWHILWPGFILAVALGLFELYWFGSREKELLIPVGILGSISLIFFVQTLDKVLIFGLKKYIIPVILIVLGFTIAFGNKFRFKNTANKTTEKPTNGEEN
ncbi:MAG: hypothetical protein HPY74_10940 [Firmicutes bacterium]|nr:hypothetical protein [Bacillota bacterium]